MSVAVHRLQRGWDRLDGQAVQFMSAHGVRLLRIALALVFLWFGLLKVIGRSPASDLVVQTVFWLPPHMTLQVVGWWETLIGVGLLFTTPLILRLTLFLLWLQMAGTFQVLVLLPQVAFQGGNPLFPTLEGQYVIKNLVLIAGGLVIGSTVRRSSRSSGQPALACPARQLCYHLGGDESARMRVEWDEQRNGSKIRKHGLDFTDAWEIFSAPMLAALDDREDYGEDRWIGIGMLRERIVVVVFTEPNEDTIRIVSLRKALSHERRRYEQALRDRLGTD